MRATRLVSIGIIVVLVAATALAYVTFGSGTLVVKLRDPPSWGPAEMVYITFSDIAIHRADAGNESGWFNTGVKGVDLNLLQMVNVSKVIGQTSLQAGLYNVIRFEITKAIVTVGGANYVCAIESGKLNIPITKGGVKIETGQTSYLEIDITPAITGKKDRFKLVPAATATPV